MNHFSIIVLRLCFLVECWFFPIFLLANPSAVNYILQAFAVNYMRACRTNLLRILYKAEALNRGSIANERIINDHIIIHMHQGGEVG